MGTATIQSEELMGRPTETRGTAGDLNVSIWKNLRRQPILCHCESDEAKIGMRLLTVTYNQDREDYRHGKGEYHT